MLSFRPLIVREESIVEFPRPILVCRLHDTWDYLKLKVPLRAGDQVAGPSRDGVGVTIEGQLGSHSGSLTLNEAEMLAALMTLRNALNVDGDDFFQLALFEDAATSRYRYFQSCVTSRFDIDFSSHHIFSYSVSVHASDPVLYDGPIA